VGADARLHCTALCDSWRRRTQRALNATNDWFESRVVLRTFRRALLFSWAATAWHGPEHAS
jgi:hypothetical protein